MDKRIMVYGMLFVIIILMLSGCDNSESPTTETTESPTVISTEPPTEQITVVPTIIEDIRRPTYLPEGVEEDPVMENLSMVITEYYLGNDFYCSLSQKVYNDSDKYFDNEGVIVRTVSINTHEATLLTYESKDEMYLVWTDGEYIYQLYSYCVPVDEFIKIAESIQ